jgi:hypothetical protein
MWQRISKPDVLVYLDVSLATLRERKPGHLWTTAILSEQERRLGHARSFCDLYLYTDSLTPEQVLSKTRRFLENLGC